MKQLLFLLLFPCLALAQYQGNGNQKITLGEQTSADGLVYRGVANDTALITPFSDTSAYIILDTVNNRFFHYKRNTNVWSIAGGSDTSLIAYVNTYGTQTVNGAKTFTSDIIGARFNPSATTASGTGMFTPTSTSIGFSTNGTNKMTLDASGNLGLGVTPNSNWFTGGKILQIGATASLINNGSNNSLFAHNVIFNNSTSDYLITGAASYYRQLSGDHAWFTAPSGGAGTSAPFTQVMLLSNSGNLSIGASGTANAKLEVLHTASTTIPALQVLSTGSLANNDIFKFGVIGLTNGFRMFQNASSVLNYTFENGNVGIGTTSPVEKLHVDGNARITAVGAGTFANNLNITSDGTLTTATSDEKYKYNILPITYGLNTILQLKPVNFQWIKGEEQDLGFIAQDVAEIIPEAVNTNWNSDLLIRYESIIPILTKAIQEQQALIKALEQRILILENK
jgi:hypothetical protein